jgi:hypothetical protein
LNTHIHTHIHASGVQTPRCPRQGPSPSKSSHSSGKVRQSAVDAQQFDLKDRELTPARDQEEVLMDASVLTGKAAVLSQRSAGDLAYALWDRDVFVSSEEWESAHREETGYEEEDDDEESALMRAQMSQDY